MATEQCTKCKRDGLQLVTTGGRSRLCPGCFDRYVRTKYLGSLDVWRRESSSQRETAAAAAAAASASGATVGAKQAGRPVLVPVSGGPSSAALAYLLHDSYTRTHGRAPRPILLHVDDAAYSGRDRVETSTTLRWLVDTCTGISLVIKSMDGATSSLDAVLHGVAVADGTLDRTLSCLRSKSSQEDVVEIQRGHLYMQAARHHDCAAIMLGDSATRLAAKALSLVAQGRGERLAEDIAESVRLDSTGFKELWLLRPNKRLLQTELLMFAQQVGVPCEIQRAADDRPDSIGGLTQQYFVDLEAQFPSLVNTVARITDKLIRVDGAADELACAVCRSSIATDSDDWDSRVVIDRLDNETDRDGTQQEQAPPLCYGCRVTFTDATESLDWDAIIRARQALNASNRQAIVDEFELPDET